VVVGHSLKPVTFSVLPKEPLPANPEETGPMKTLKIAMITAMVALFCARAMAVSNIVLSCTTYNFATNLPQTSFHPGDKVLVLVSYSFPTGTFGINPGKHINLSLNATATFPGFTFPFSLNPVISTLPNSNPKVGGALFTSGGSQTAIFKISKHIPVGSRLTIFLTASAAGVAPGSCSATINVVAP
jgi:hypothetical protein